MNHNVCPTQSPFSRHTHGTQANDRKTVKACAVCTLHMCVSGALFFVPVASLKKQTSAAFSACGQKQPTEDKRTVLTRLRVSNRLDIMLRQEHLNPYTFIRFEGPGRVGQNKRSISSNNLRLGEIALDHLEHSNARRSCVA